MKRNRKKFIDEKGNMRMNKRKGKYWKVAAVLLCLSLPWPVRAGKVDLGGFDISVGPGPLPQEPTSAPRPTAKPVPSNPVTVKPSPPPITANPSSQPVTPQPTKPVTVKPPKPVTSQPTSQPNVPKPSGKPTTPRPTKPVTIKPTSQPSVPKPSSQPVTPKPTKPATVKPTSQPSEPRPSSKPATPKPPKPATVKPTSQPSMPDIIDPDGQPGTSNRTSLATVEPANGPSAVNPGTSFTGMPGKFPSLPDFVTPKSSESPTKEHQGMESSSEGFGTSKVIKALKGAGTEGKEKVVSESESVLSHSEKKYQSLDFLPLITVDSHCPISVLSFCINDKEVFWHWEGEQIVPEEVSLKIGENTVSLCILEDSCTLWEIKEWKFFVKNL